MASATNGANLGLGTENLEGILSTTPTVAVQFIGNEDGKSGVIRCGDIEIPIKTKSEGRRHLQRLQSIHQGFAGSLEPFISESSLDAVQQELEDSSLDD